MKKLVSIVLSLALLLGLLPFTLPVAQAAGPSISIALGQSSAAPGGTITVTYSVANRKGNIDAYLYIDGEWEDTKNLSASSGSFSFTLPKFGKSGQIEITADDGLGGYISKFSSNFSISSGVSIEPNIRVNKTSAAPGEYVTVSWNITGGVSPQVSYVQIRSYEMIGNVTYYDWFEANSGSFARTGSKSMYVPGFGRSALFRLYVEDSGTGYKSWYTSPSFAVSGGAANGWAAGEDSTSSGWAFFRDGQPVKGWLQTDYHTSSDWFYFQPYNGLTKWGWNQIDHQWYYFMDVQDDDNWHPEKMLTDWALIEGKDWYYFGSDGAMQTGWLESGGSWYYLGGDGKMRTGWVNAGGAWYYINKDGVMQTGWVKDGNNWYYLKADGSMATGWVQDGRSWYYMNASGVMQTGWVNAGGSWYYMNNSGAMKTGWLQEGSSWYYLTPSGSMATGEYTVDGTVSVFNASGVWVSYK